MLTLYNGELDEEKTLRHYDNSTDVNQDTFDYIMKIVEFQYLIGKQEHNEALKITHKQALYLCGFNLIDLYFFLQTYY